MSLLQDRMLRLPSALLVATVTNVLAISISPRDSRTPAPITVHPDQNWDGIDGSWSTFTLRIGNPPQYVRTLVSWTSYQTWAVIPEGCSTSADIQHCSEARGWIFDAGKSVTFNEIGLYDLSIEQNLGYAGNAIYGYDTVGLGGVGEEGPTINYTIVGGMAYPDFYMGIFGINPKPTNFTSFNDPSTSYMTLLKGQNYIPSVSFGYTAGASYKSTGELASLTLGGYDTAKLVENDVVFHFASDNSRDIVVAVQAVTTPSRIDSSPNPTLLLASPIYAYLDATIAEIWLPFEACRAFEIEFGLLYDESSELYLVNDTLHTALLERNPSITFDFGPELKGGKSVVIELPYAAFDLLAQPPYQAIVEQSRYFPLRRANNDTQYTIGRAFFQEAYITVDYESQTFNVSQRSWATDEPDVVAIPAYTGKDQSAYPGARGRGNPSSRLGGGIVAVIAVATAVLIGIIGLAIVCFLRRCRNRGDGHEGHEKLNNEAGSTSNVVRAASHAAGVNQDIAHSKAELAGSLPAVPTESNHDILQSSFALSPDGTITPRTPHARLGSAFPSNVNSSFASPTIDGHGTHSSSSTAQDSGGGVSIVSPMTPLNPPVFEMAGDTPKIREKDGHELSEKEAIAHREKMYNGVESPIASSSANGYRAKHPVNAMDVKTYGAINESPVFPARSDFGERQAFSFEEERTNDSGSHYSQDDI